MAQQQQQQATTTTADVQKIKDEFIELHNQVPELISDDALKPLLGLVRDSKIDPDYLQQRLKRNIKEALLAEFENMWQTLDFDVHLAVLQQATKRTAGKGKAWRPTGKSPEEQVRGIESSSMKFKMTYLEELIKEQCDELNQVLPAVETNRTNMRNLLVTREAVLTQLASNHEYYKEVHDDVDRLRKVLQEKILEVSSK
ncbi:uncharacterized protein LOC134830209 [Culicoides brevitarsis]|uniref:uncharacterized protein LOC134830209 n=1 Tax=Culicoides brevitarsis TaxID=469753 RepID=UPI00307B1F87